MPKEFSRSRRVAELLQRELALLVQQYTQNSDMGMVTISTIDVSPDLKNAKTFITCLGNTKGISEIVNMLNGHAGQFRHELTKMVILRVIPKLCFEFDHSLDRANKLTSLIDSLHPDSADKKNSDR